MTRADAPWKRRRPAGRPAATVAPPRAHAAATAAAARLWSSTPRPRDPRVLRAVAGRRLLAVRYRGSDRLIEPWCYGAAADGTELLRGWQRLGWSRSGRSTGWKLFHVAALERVRAAWAFSPRRDDFAPEDPAMAWIFARIHA